MSADTDAVSTSQSSGHSDQHCIICRTDFDEASVKGKHIKATAKGLTTLMRFSEMRGDTQLHDLLSYQPTEVYYHYEYQKEYTNERLFQQQKRQSNAAVADVVSSKSLRSSVSLFEWKEHCYLRAVGRKVLWSSARVCLSVCLCALFLSARYLKNRFMDHHQIWWVGAGGEPLEEV